MEHILTIRNMVCDRCKYVVRKLLADVDLQTISVDLGSVHLERKPTLDQQNELQSLLEKFGFELVDDPKAKTIEHAKRIIIDYVRSENKSVRHKLSAVLSKELGMSYGHFTTLFHAQVGVTVERYLILQRIEYVKELLQYKELTLTEISDRIGCSSPQYLSTQFKSVTGLTAIEYRNQLNARSSIDHIGTT